MNKHDQYVLDKTMYAYDLYLKGEYFKKARAVIVKDGQVLFIKNSKGGLTVPGGGVDQGESILQAAEREAFEETGIKVRPIKEIGANYYDVDMQLGDVDFVSKRVEYIYLCEYLEQIADLHGLDGEYDKMPEIIWGDIDQLKLCFMSDEVIGTVKEYIENGNEKK